MRHGDVNLLGFGAGITPLWGAVAASGAGTAASIAARAVGHGKYSEGIGLFVGLATGGAMWAFPSTSDAGKLGVAVTLATQGLRVLESLLFGAPALAPDASLPVGWTTTETANPLLGMPSAQQIAGPMGYAMATQQPHAYGTVPGVAGPQRDNGYPPVSQNNGPGLSSLYGATIY